MSTVKSVPCSPHISMSPPTLTVDGAVLYVTKVLSGVSSADEKLWEIWNLSALWLPAAPTMSLPGPCMASAMVSNVDVPSCGP